MVIEDPTGLADSAFGTGGTGGTCGVAGVIGSAGLGSAGGATEFDFTLVPSETAEFLGIAALSGTAELGVILRLRTLAEVFPVCKGSPDP